MSMPRFVTAIVLFCVALPALACSRLPLSYIFPDRLRESSSVFLFRLNSLEKKPHGRFEGSIQVMETLKGDTPAFSRVAFVRYTMLCSGVRLDAGHTFIVATNQRGKLLNLETDSYSLVDVTHYGESLPERDVREDLIVPIKHFLAGAALSDDVLPEDVVEYTVATPPPPPPPPPPKNR